MATIVRYPRLRVFFDRGQLVHHAEFGAGTITGICGCTITVAFSDQPRELDIEKVVTRTQAEEGWQACYAHGGNRRLEEGRWLWIVRSLCARRRGDWTAFLEKWGIPRSSAFDLIQRFLQERFAETQQSSGNRTDTAAKIDEQTADRAKDLNAGRKQVVNDELANREGAAKHTYWTVRIKLPEDVAEDCRERYKEADAAAKRYWVRTAYRFVDREDELDWDSDATDQGGSSDK